MKRTIFCGIIFIASCSTAVDRYNVINVDSQKNLISIVLNKVTTDTVDLKYILNEAYIHEKEKLQDGNPITIAIYPSERIAKSPFLNTEFIANLVIHNERKDFNINDRAIQFLNKRKDGPYAQYEEAKAKFKNPEDYCNFSIDLQAIYKETYSEADKKFGVGQGGEEWENFISVQNQDKTIALCKKYGVDTSIQTIIYSEYACY